MNGVARLTNLSVLNLPANSISTIEGMCFSCSFTIDLYLLLFPLRFFFFLRRCELYSDTIIAIKSTKISKVQKVESSREVCVGTHPGPAHILL